MWFEKRLEAGMGSYLPQSEGRNMLPGTEGMAKQAGRVHRGLAFRRMPFQGAAKGWGCLQNKTWTMLGTV